MRHCDRYCYQLDFLERIFDWQMMYYIYKCQSCIWSRLTCLSGPLICKLHLRFQLPSQNVLWSSASPVVKIDYGFVWVLELFLLSHFLIVWPFWFCKRKIYIQNWFLLDLSLRYLHTARFAESSSWWLSAIFNLFHHD